MANGTDGRWWGPAEWWESLGHPARPVYSQAGARPPLARYDAAGASATRPGADPAACAAGRGPHPPEDAQDGEGVPEARRRQRRPARDRGRRCRACPRPVGDQPPVRRIDDGRRPGGVAAGRRASGLDRAEDGHRQVLAAREAVGAVEPAVVRDVHQERGAVPDRCPDEIGMHDLVTDRNADRHEAPEHARARARRELLGAVVGRTTIRRDERFLLREEHEPPLVVRAAVSAGGRDQARRVVRVTVLEPGSAEQQIGAMPLGEASPAGRRSSARSRGSAAPRSPAGRSAPDRPAARRSRGRAPPPAHRCRRASSGATATRSSARSPPASPRRPLRRPSAPRGFHRSHRRRSRRSARRAPSTWTRRGDGLRSSAARRGPRRRCWSARGGTRRRTRR
jgi:hypothetical protein